MKTPSVKALVDTFGISAEKAGLIKRIGRAVDDSNALADALAIALPGVVGVTERLPSTIRHSNRLWCRTYALRAFNEILGMHGVEALYLGAGVEAPNGPRFEYLNAGDTYAATLIYDSGQDRLFIGSWGDIAERMSA